MESPTNRRTAWLTTCCVSTKAESKTTELKSYGRRLGRRGALAAFIVAASAIPDDRIVIPLGLTRYSPIKLFVAYFLGKAPISVIGSYLGQCVSLTFENLLPTNDYIALTAVLLVPVLVKVDLSAIFVRLARLVRKN